MLVAQQEEAVGLALVRQRATKSLKSGADGGDCDKAAIGLSGCTAPPRGGDIPIRTNQWTEAAVRPRIAPSRSLASRRLDRWHLTGC